MLAHRIQFDVLDQHQLVGIHVEVLLQHIGRGSLQTGEQLAARAGDAIGRLHQALALGILANRLQEQAYGFAHAFLVVCAFLPLARLYIFVHLISPLSLSTTTSARPVYVRNHMTGRPNRHRVYSSGFMPTERLRLSGISTGGLSESGRRSLDSHTGRTGAFLIGAKISASSFSFRVSLTSS